MPLSQLNSEELNSVSESVQNLAARNKNLHLTQGRVNESKARDQMQISVFTIKHERIKETHCFIHKRLISQARLFHFE